MSHLRTQSNLSALFMAFFMSGIMTLAMGLIRGSGEFFIVDFLMDWALSFSVALPTVFLIFPWVGRLARFFAKEVPVVASATQLSTAVK